MSKVLVIGSGGREDALARKLAQSPSVHEVICAPGNGGTERESKCWNADIAATNIDRLVRLAVERQVDLTVVGPEAPLVAGIVDAWPKGLRIFGPSAYAAQLEGRKTFAKGMMEEHGIPTAPWRFFDHTEHALSWLGHVRRDIPWVVKADGLCGGKGVRVCDNRSQTLEAIIAMSDFGEAGSRFIIEKRLEGIEATLLLIVGRHGEIISLETAQDYKPAYDGDKGPNTGGMGAYSPASHLTPTMIQEIITKLRPLIVDVGFTGLLYVGLMLTKDGWKVLEFNVRFGDPETQVVLPRLKTDLFQLLYAIAGGGVWPELPQWSEKACVSVVMTSGGYPGSYINEYPIFGLDKAAAMPGVTVFHAGTCLSGDKVLTAGGRVLNVTALGNDISAARERAYRAVHEITWENETHRTDIAKGV